MKREEKRVCSNSTLIYNAIGFTLCITAAIVFQVLFIEDDKKEEWVIDWTSDNKSQDRYDFIVTFSLIGCIIAFTLFVISSLDKRVLCRVIPCAEVNIPTEVIRVGTMIMQAFSIGLATVMVMNQT